MNATRRSKIDIYFSADTDHSDPVLTLYGSFWMQNPSIQLTDENWDAPLQQSWINFPKPATSSGGMYVDKYPNWGGKILSLGFILRHPDDYDRQLAIQKVQSLTSASDTLDLKRTLEFPTKGKRMVDYLNGCILTDVGDQTYPNQGQVKYMFTLTSKNKSSTVPVETSL